MTGEVHRTREGQRALAGLVQRSRSAAPTEPAAGAAGPVGSGDLTVRDASLHVADEGRPHTPAQARGAVGSLHVLRGAGDRPVRRLGLQVPTEPGQVAVHLVDGELDLGSGATCCQLERVLARREVARDGPGGLHATVPADSLATDHDRLGVHRGSHLGAGGEAATARHQLTALIDRCTADDRHSGVAILVLTVAAAVVAVAGLRGVDRLGRGHGEGDGVEGCAGFVEAAEGLGAFVGQGGGCVGPGQGGA